MKSISARNLFKTYWFYEREAGVAGAAKALFRGRKVYVEAVRGINLEASLGEVIGFIGPNGAGKTTTLKMLSGILYRTKGQVEVLGFTPSKREKEFLKSITLISGQRNRLFWDLPAEDYFQLIKTIYEIPEELFQRNLSELFELAEIGDILKVPQRKLSFGQRKRCKLVTGLLHGPKIIFLDEPTNALDLINARKIREFIKEKRKEGESTINLTSHNVADIEQVCERVVIINLGKIAFDGCIRDLSRMDGVKRQMRIVFHGPWSAEKIKVLGNINEGDGQEILREVDAEKATEVASILFANFPVRDLSMTSTPLEKIIESIYLESGSVISRKSMNFNSILAYIAALSSLVTAIVVIYRDPRSFVHRMFTVGMGVLALGAILTALGYQSTSLSELMRWQRLKFLPPVFIARDLVALQPEFRPGQLS